MAEKTKGIGVMIALGRPGRPPRYQAQPDARSASGEKGGDPPATPHDPDAGRPEQSVTVSPEAVDYHDSSEACDVCEYWAGGQCRVLKMQVDPKGHCEAFEAKGDSDTMGEQYAEEHSEQFGGR